MRARRGARARSALYLYGRGLVQRGMPSAAFRTCDFEPRSMMWATVLFQLARHASASGPDLRPQFRRATALKSPSASMPLHSHGHLLSQLL